MTHADFPPHSRRPADVWASARADYETGASIRIVAERYGLNVRTVSRHAHEEGWPAPRLPAAETYAGARAERDYNPSALNSMATVNHVKNRDDEALLLRPDTLGLCQFAFRRAAECASVSGPTEALAWIRLAQATAGLRQRVDVDVHPMSQADYRRVAALEREESDALFEAIGEAPTEHVNPWDEQVSESVPRNSADTDTSP